jgi:hypothetical protein
LYLKGGGPFREVPLKGGTVKVGAVQGVAALRSGCSSANVISSLF